METASLQAMRANWAIYLDMQEQATTALEDRKTTLRGELAGAVYGLAADMRQALKEFEKGAPYAVEVRAAASSLGCGQ